MNNMKPFIALTFIIIFTSSCNNNSFQFYPSFFENEDLRFSDEIESLKLSNEIQENMCSYDHYRMMLWSYNKNDRMNLELKLEDFDGIPPGNFIYSINFVKINNSWNLYDVQYLNEKFTVQTYDNLNIVDCLYNP